MIHGRITIETPQARVAAEGEDQGALDDAYNAEVNAEILLKSMGLADQYGAAIVNVEVEYPREALGVPIDANGMPTAPELAVDEASWDKSGDALEVNVSPGVEPSMRTLSSEEWRQHRGEVLA